MTLSGKLIFENDGEEKFNDFEEDDTQPRTDWRFCKHCMGRQTFIRIGNHWFCELCGLPYSKK